MKPADRQSGRTTPGLIYVLILSLVMGLQVSISLNAASKTEPDEVKLKQLRDRITQLRRTQKNRLGQKSKVRLELRQIEKSSDQINRQTRQLRKQISAQKKSLRGLYKQQKKHKKRITQQREQLASQVRASYAMGRQEQLKIVLNQGDPAKLQRSLVYFDYLNRSRSEQIQSVLKELNQLEQLEVQINTKKQSLETLFANQAEKKQALLKTQSARKAILKKLSRDITSSDKKLARMLQDEKEIQQILRAVESSLGDIPAKDLEGKPIAQRKGRLPWPANGKIRTKFGSQRAVGGLRWSGVMIDAKAGQNVVAIARGRVAFADWLRGYGLMLIIDHGEGFMSLYGHNQSQFKEIGEWVEEGETIAIIGSSGGQSRSQLYFELRYKGKPVNPVKWCRRTRGGIVSLN